MALKQAVDPPESIEERGFGEVAHLGQNCIKCRSTVSFGKNKAVTCRPGWTAGIDAQLMFVQDQQNFHDRQGAAGMAGLDGIDHFEDVAPDLPGLFRQFPNAGVLASLLFIFHAQ